MAATPTTTKQVRAPAYAPLVLLAAAMATGIVFDRCCPLPATAWWLAALTLIIAWLVTWLGQRDRRASCLLLLCYLAIGGAWHHAYWHVYAANEIGRMMRERSRPCVVEAVAVTSPRWVPAPAPTALRTIPQGERSELSVWLTAIRDGQTMRSASGWADLDIEGPTPDLRSGDRLRIFAQGGRGFEPLNPGEFNFIRYQRSQRVGCRLFAEFPQSVERLSRGSHWSPRRWLADLRSGGLAILRQFIQGERANLASAVLLGAREQLDNNRNEAYLVTGTIHILSISGIHVGILAGGLFLILRLGFVSRPVALATIIGVTIVYALLTDLQPPVVRAAVLVVVACLALWTSRSSFGFNSLAFAALIVLVINPASLLLAGTQLSFLAVATMIVFHSRFAPQKITDPLDRLIANTRPWLVRLGKRAATYVWQLWLLGVFIWLVSGPLVWQQYNLISPSSLVLNFLMALPVAVGMYGGLGTLAFGSWIPVVGRMYALLCERSFAFSELLIENGRTWPGSYYWMPAPPSWWIAVFYLGLAIAIALPPLRPKKYWLFTLTLAWCAGALILSQSSVAALPRRSDHPLVCHFVAVGHGLSVLIELPNGQTILYDAGRLGSPLAGVRPISSVLWQRGIRHLDAIVISHADADHFNSIPGLLERFSVGAVYVSPAMFRRLPDAVKELRDSIERRRVPLREIYAGQCLAAGSTIKLEVLHPTRKSDYRSDNANSIVLLIEYRGQRILLTGDLEPPGLDDVLAEDSPGYHVVSAPHHGSPRSNPGKFADWSQPRHVVVSGSIPLGDEATVASVNDSFRLRGAEVYHTAEDGCVRVEVDAKGTRVFTHRQHVRASPAGLPNAKFLQTK